VAAQLFDASLTTTEMYYPSLRNPGGAAFYCRTHRLPAPGYHKAHCDLLQQFYVLSGDSRFKKLADELRSDV
jgi:hypothetical protein